MTQNGDVAVRLDGARKTYGEVVAVDRVDLDIREDEFFTLLGPSGSGKTTCLRMIAGFERPDEGRVELAGRDVTDLPPYERDVNTVFQDYALFPHMSVGENVEYGLRIARCRQGGAPPARERGARDGAARRLREAPHRPALGRPAPAGRARARAREPAEGAAPRRAAGRARPQAAPADAERAAHDPRRGRHHVRLRDARPGGGAHHERPHGRLRRRADRAGRPAGGRLRAPGERVRRRVRGRLEHRRTRRAALHDPAREGPDPGGRRERERAARRGGPHRDVSYVGMVTRYVVELDRGGELQVVRQNLEMSSQEALEQRGRRVRVGWHGEHAYAIPDSQERQPRRRDEVDWIADDGAGWCSPS